MPVDAKLSRSVFQKLQRDVVKLGSKPQAENVHRFRTGTRRLQILLGELSPKLDRNERKLLKLLGQVRRRAGKVRDLDVQLSSLRRLKVAQEPRRKTQLVNRLIERRSRQEKKLSKAVDAGTIRQILKRLERARKNFNPETGRDPLTVARHMLNAIDHEQPVNEALLHRYRILSKRSRYAAEFAGHSAEAQRFTAQLKRIQDALGDWHDWFTLMQSASADLGDVRESALVAELHNVTGAKFRHAVALLAQMRAHLISKEAPAGPAPARVPVKTVRTASAA